MRFRKIALRKRGCPTFPASGCPIDSGVSRLRLIPCNHCFAAGGTYSFGTADPSPKKNWSICLTMTS